MTIYPIPNHDKNAFARTNRQTVRQRALLL